MTNILITGANSYIGCNVEKWLNQFPDKYSVNIIDMKTPEWIEHDFANYDVVFHVAGIAHVPQNKKMSEVYMGINCDLAVATAKKCKNSGVKHFIFMSSMIVYGSNETLIDQKTIPKPDNIYGLSKLMAEKELTNLVSNSFRLSIIRSPMIYGFNSKGNFPKLLRLSKKTFLFPKYHNKRSMLYIDNLSRVVKAVIDEKVYGILFPQDREYVSTYLIVKEISRILHRKVIYFRFLNPLLRFLTKKINLVNKMFSDFYYIDELSSRTRQYCTDALGDVINVVLEGDQNDS